MRRLPLSLALCMLTMLIVNSALSAAQVTSVTLCKEVVEPDLVPVDITEEFSSKAPELHAIVKLQDVEDGTLIKGAWVSVNAIDQANYTIDALEMKMKTGDATAHFALSKPDRDWPAGDYRLEVSINGQLATIKTFKVVPAPESAVTKDSRAPDQGAAPRPSGQAAGDKAGQEGTAPAGRGYSGTYVMDAQGVRVTLLLSEDSQGVLTGTLSSTTGMQFQVEGQAEEGAAAGVCYSGDMGAFFEAYGEGDQLWFSLIEADANNMPDYNTAQDFVFTKVTGGSTPTPGPGTTPRTTAIDPTGSGSGAPAVSAPSGSGGGDRVPRPPQGQEASTAAGSSGGTYKHPAGFTFWYPAGWTAQITEGVLQLIPPNAGSSPDGPTEVYIVTGESVAGEGIFSAEDPRVIEYMDQQVRSVSPFLTLKGGPKPASISQGNGIELNWEGTSPRGDVIHARAFVAILYDHGISLVGIALKDLLQARDADLRKMFSSFGVGQGENDPAVVGSWRLVSTSAIDNQSPFETAWSRAQAVSETQTVLDLRADGTCTWNSKTQTIVGAGDVWLEDNSSSASQGRWNAGNGIIYIMWDDNTYRDCMYRLENAGGGLRLRMACGGKGEVWEPAR